MTQTTSFTTRCRSVPSPGPGWTRREFVRGAAGMVALPHLPAEAAAAQSPRFAYVASGESSLHALSWQGGAWIRTQRVPSAAPVCILLCPAQRTLYVANEIDVYEGLPRGTVEAFHIGPHDGRLTLLERTPLSLSATSPRHMAISPDGKLLAVAAYGGGIYNLFRVAEDGRLSRQPSIFKQAGCGTDARTQGSAHPHTLIFDAYGKHLISSDFGSDRLSVFAVEDGRLAQRMQRTTPEGSGPSGCALHPGGSVLYAQHEMESALVSYRYDAGSGNLGETVQRLPFDTGLRALAIHPSGRMLYTTEGQRNALRAWSIDEKDGTLSHAQSLFLATPGPITISPDGESVFVLDRVNGSVLKVNADRAGGALFGRSEVAVVDGPRSLALKTI
jgi:6-phosphogluconolactonase